MKKYLLIIGVAALIIFVGIYFYFSSINQARIETAEDQNQNTYFSQDCNLKIKLKDGSTRTVTTLAHENYEFPDCDYVSIMSEDEKYVFFEDRSGSIDLMVNVYSVELDASITLGVWGTSRLSDQLFDGSTLYILAGLADEDKPQRLESYDVEVIFADYPENIEEWGYLRDGYATYYETPLETGKYSGLRKTENGVELLGKNNKVLFTVK